MTNGAVLRRKPSVLTPPSPAGKSPRGWITSAVWHRLAYQSREPASSNSGSFITTIKQGGWGRSPVAELPPITAYGYEPTHQALRQIAFSVNDTPVLYGNLQYDSLLQLRRISYHNGDLQGTLKAYSDFQYTATLIQIDMSEHYKGIIKGQAFYYMRQQA